MPSQEPAAEAARRDDRPPTMRELLAACASATAVSTPPREEPAGPAEPAEDSASETEGERAEGERRRDAA